MNNELVSIETTLKSKNLIKVKIKNNKDLD